MLLRNAYKVWVNGVVPAAEDRSNRRVTGRRVIESALSGTIRRHGTFVRNARRLSTL